MSAGTQLSRRGMLAAAAGTVTVGVANPAQAAAGTLTRAARSPGSLAVPRALAFLAAAADAYPQANPGVRLAQSYADELGLFSTAFVYDNALAVLAHIGAGCRYLGRARELADALLYAQDHDPAYADGRLRQAYNVGPYTFYDGNPQPHGFVQPDGSANVAGQFGFLGTAVGDMAWAGLALTQLYARTRRAGYLAGAVRIGRWIVDHTYSEQPLGGFTFGVDGSNAPVTVSSTEHNIDVAAFFTLLAPLTRDRSWTHHARHAKAFVARMWDSRGGFFFTGSNDGSTVNPSPVPEDAQDWSWLALRDRRFAAAPDWVARRLAVKDSSGMANSSLPSGVTISGVTFSSASLTSGAQYNGITVHQQGVWLEGSAHLASALFDRGHPGDEFAAACLLSQLGRAQNALGAGQHLGGRALAPRGGLVAASSLIDTGFGFGYFPVQHVGATAWATMAALRMNPYRHRAPVH